MIGFILNVCVVIVILFFTLKSLNKTLITVSFASKREYLVALTLLHYIITLFFWYVSLGADIDAIKYYNPGVSFSYLLNNFNFGTVFLKIIIYPFVKLGISYFTLTMLFSFIGLLGFYQFIKIIDDQVKIKSVFSFSLIFFLFVTLHIWTVYIGKDAIIFYANSIILSGIHFKKTKKTIFFLALIFVFLIRPQVLFIYIIAYLITYFINNKVALETKIFIIYVSISTLYLFLPVIFEYANINEFSIDALIKKIERINSYGSRYGGSKVDLTDESYFFKVFTFLFRPLFYDIKSISQLLVSVQNLILLLFSLKFLINIHLALKFNKFNKAYSFAFFSFIISTIVFSAFIYNLGLADRQKLINIPYFIYCYSQLFYTKKE